MGERCGCPRTDAARRRGVVAQHVGGGGDDGSDDDAAAILGANAVALRPGRTTGQAKIRRF